jgi:hypothetical protein
MSELIPGFDPLQNGRLAMTARSLQHNLNCAGSLGSAAAGKRSDPLSALQLVLLEVATCAQRRSGTGCKLVVQYGYELSPAKAGPQFVASGFEAGGHRGSFLRSSEDSLTGTISLVPQIVDAVGVPVVAAGGIADARGIAAAFALGAEGVQMGTVFLACEESGASSLHREAILSGKAIRTSLTRGFTGRLARGIHNQLLEEMNRPGVALLPYPLQRALMRNLAVPAQQAGRSEFLALWAGQSAGLARYPGVTTLLQSLVNGVSEKLG